MPTYYYAVFDHLGKCCSIWPTRHDAVGAVERYHDANDYEIQPVRPQAALELDARWKHPDWRGSA